MSQKEADPFWGPGHNSDKVEILHGSGSLQNVQIQTSIDV